MSVHVMIFINVLKCISNAYTAKNLLSSLFFLYSKLLELVNMYIYIYICMAVPINVILFPILRFIYSHVVKHKFHGIQTLFDLHHNSIHFKIYYQTCVYTCDKYPNFTIFKTVLPNMKPKHYMLLYYIY